MAERGAIAPIIPQQPQAAPTTPPQSPAQLPLGRVRACCACILVFGGRVPVLPPSRPGGLRENPSHTPQRNMSLYWYCAQIAQGWVCGNSARFLIECNHPLSNPHDSWGLSGSPWPSSRLSVPGQRALRLWQLGHLQHSIPQSWGLGRLQRWALARAWLGCGCSARSGTQGINT